MNLIDMLNAPVEPLGYRAPATNPKRTWARNNTAANDAKRKQAIVKYRAGMGAEWCSTRTIECRLGMGRSACLPNLNKWFAEGILEKRKTCPNPDWNRNKGYEWKFK